MAPPSEFIELLRIMVDDYGTSPKYSDTDIERVIITAAYQIAGDQLLTFNEDFTINIIERTITPDPTATATQDISFVNLVCMKAACIIERGAALTSAGQGLRVKDDSSEVDLRNVASGRLNLLKINWCKEFEEERDKYLMNKNYAAGSIVMTPFRLDVRYSNRI